MKLSRIRFYMFVILIIGACIPYIAYAIKGIQTDQTILFSVGLRDSVRVGSLGKMFTSLKDAAVLALFVLCLLQMTRQTYRAVVAAVIVVIYGCAMLFYTELWDMLFVIAGIRTYIYALTVLMYCWGNRQIFEMKNMKLIYRVIQWIVVIHAVLVFFQVSQADAFAYFGSGAWRFTGACAASGNLGCLVLAIMTYFLIIRFKYRLISDRTLWLNFALLFFISLATGMRASNLLLSLLGAVGLSYNLVQILHIKKRETILFLAVIVIVCTPAIIAYVVERTGRGEIMDSGTTRIQTLYTLLFGQAFRRTFLGYGLGFGTNAALIMGLESTGTKTLDGTINTLLAQFGLVGTIPFLYGMISVFVNMVKKSAPWGMIAVCFCAMVTMIVFTGNLFEQIAMCVLLVYCYFLLTNRGEQENTDKLRPKRTWRKRLGL